MRVKSFNMLRVSGKFPDQELVSLPYVDTRDDGAFVSVTIDLCNDSRSGER